MAQRPGRQVEAHAGLLLDGQFDVAVVPIDRAYLLAFAKNLHPGCDYPIGSDEPLQHRHPVITIGTDTHRAALHDVSRHIRHICDLAGSADHAAIGTDMDGGLGRDQIPREIVTSADLPRLADALANGGFSDADILKIMSGNWLRYFRENLPAETFN